MKTYSALTQLEDRKEYAAWDLETEGLGGKVTAASCCLEGAEPRYVCGDPVDIIHTVVNWFEESPKHLWYAHNAQYDWRYLFDEFDLRGYEYELVMRTDNDVFMIQCKTHDKTKITLVDSMAFYNSSLRNLLRAFAPHLPKGDIDFEKMNFNPRDPAHVAYSKRDSEGLVTGLVNLDRKLVSLFGVHLGLTTASTALRAWRHTLEEGDRFYNDEENETFIRGGYFGGLVFLTDTREHQDVVTIDINSSYPHVMRSLGVPYGGVCRRKSIDWSKPGLYRVRVFAPENLRIPILPLRQGKIVIWPRGIFETTSTREELQFAVANGYKILEVLEGLVWSQMWHPFNKIINKTEKMRVEYRGQPEEDLAKLMQNALSGKFGTRRERRKIFRPTRAQDCEGASPWSMDERFWFRMEYVEDMLCLPQWIVYITAQARLNLLRAAYSVGVENAIYGDTDSLTIPADHARQFPQTTAYGDWKISHSWNRFRAVAPKVYAGVENETWLGAIKGIPQKLMQNENKGVNLWPSLYEGQCLDVQLETVPKLIQFLKTSKGGSYKQHRKSTLLHNSRSWVELENGDVLPRTTNKEGEHENVESIVVPIDSAYRIAR